MSRAHVLETAAERCLYVGGAQQSARCVEAQELLDRTPDGNHARRIAEQLEIAHVPRDQAQLAVDNAYALRQVLERRAQELAVELNDV